MKLCKVESMYMILCVILAIPFLITMGKLSRICLYDDIKKDLTQ